MGEKGDYLQNLSFINECFWEKFAQNGVKLHLITRPTNLFKLLQKGVRLPYLFEESR